jgi:hypothetical protein
MSSDFDRLKEECIEVGDSFPVMPIDEIRLSVDFAELPDQVQVVERLVRELFNYPNMHVQRIAINACRRSQQFGVRGLKEALTEKLSDSEPWVRYDAAWAIHDAKYDSPKIREELLKNAATVRLPEDELRLRGNPGNAELQSQVRARKALDALDRVDG